jgi:hypothetical protein
MLMQHNMPRIPNTYWPSMSSYLQRDLELVPLWCVVPVQLLLGALGTGGLHVVDEPDTSAQRGHRN